MHRSKMLVLALAAFAAVAVGLTGASAATKQLGRFHMIAGGTGSAQLPNALSNKPATYILEMSAKPVAVVDAARKAAGHGPMSFAQKAALTRQLASQQAPVVAAVRQINGAIVTSRFQGVYNGIAVSLPQSQAWRLGSISGVKGVYATHQYKMASVAPGDGLPLINAPQTWGGLGKYTGTGIKIADIDTGIDYTHADFGGTGTTAAFNCAAAHSTDDAATFAIDCPGVSNWYSGTKVKGGIDLVGDSYNAAGSGAQLIPQPDSNPLDCNGHGTHTAGTATGYGVDGAGNTYTGTYNANTINNTSFVIPPGVAPKADLYGVRVFGCSGSVDDAVLIDAMNWSFNNGMDVVNMSLGASFGSPTDPDSVAASNLAAEGVITVLSAGNSGPNPYITGSPGAGIGALSVAANDSTASFPAATLTLTKADTTPGGSMTAIDANGVSIPTGPFSIKVLYDSPGVISKGCSLAADGGANSLPANTFIVVRRATCARVAKAIYGQQAGAAGVIMVNNNPGLPPYEGPITSNPDTGLPYTVTIPFLGVAGGSNPSTSPNGVTLRAADGGSVSLAATTLANPNYKALASFTSYGPTKGGILKPEVTAPGVSILSAGVGKGNGGTFLSGTSMAAPHTTGTAALVKQAHPTWNSVAAWKAALVNTANPANVSNFNIRGAGAGEIDAYNATHTNVVALGDPDGTASLSYGVQDVTAKVDVTKTITLENMGGSPATFQMSNVLPQGVGHKVIMTGPNTYAPLKVRVAAHGTATVSVELIVYKDNAVGPVGGFNDWWGASKFDDAAGLIHFKPLDGSNHGISLNVPYYSVPTAVSNVVVSGIDNAALKNGATDGNVVLTNKMGALGYADWFAWGGKSDVSGSDIGSADLVNDGVQSFPTGTMSTSLVVFALQTTKSWTNPAEDVAQIDVNVDGPANPAPDYSVYSYDLGQFSAGSVNGEAVVIVCPTGPGGCVFHYLSSSMFNGTTMELPVRFSDLCLSGNPCVTDGTAITYSTYMQDRNGGADQITDNKSFDVFHPSVLTANGGSDVVGRNATVTDPLTIDPAAWSANPQLGVLVLFQNNQNTVGEAKTFSLSF